MFCLDSAGSLSAPHCRFELKFYILINRIVQELNKKVLQLKMMKNVL